MAPGVDPLPPLPHPLFDEWYADARVREPSYPESLAVATTDSRGRPGVRTVLMKGWDARGLVFYTNTEGAKGSALDHSGAAEVLFYWKSTQRQVRMHGPVARVDDAEADAYAASRPRDSQLSAWASLQSRPMPARDAYETRLADYAAHFPQSVPRPPHWTGYRLVPERFEFWEERAFRQHERWTYSLEPGGGWRAERLYP